MPAPLLIPLITSLAPAIAGLFSNRRPEQQTQNSSSTGTSSQTTNQSGTSSSTSTPNLDDATMGFRDQLMKAYAQMIGQDTDLSGFQSQGLKQISDATNRSVGNLNNFLASRGIANTEGAAIGATNLINNGATQANAFKASIPQMALDNLLKKLQSAGGFFSSIPVGQTTTGTNSMSGTSNGTQTENRSGQTTGSPADPLGGFITGAASGVAQYGNQQFQNNLASQYGRSIATNGNYNSLPNTYGRPFIMPPPATYNPGGN